jgi:hypothetical protein
MRPDREPQSSADGIRYDVAYCWIATRNHEQLKKLDRDGRDPRPSDRPFAADANQCQPNAEWDKEKNIEDDVHPTEISTANAQRIEKNRCALTRREGCKPNRHTVCNNQTSAGD